MNPLARAWAERERDRLQRRELARIAEDLRRMNAEVEPLRREAAERRRANMRQDGPDGFVMVESI